MKANGKFGRFLFVSLICCGLMFVGAASAQADDFSFTTNNGSITITGYTGTNGVVAIPGAINNLPVTSIGDAVFRGAFLLSVTIPNSVTNIGDWAFYYSSGLTNVTIPDSVSSIGVGAFAVCIDLTNMIVGAGNSNFACVGGVLFDKTITTLVQYPAGLLNASYFIPDSVTSIGGRAFEFSKLTTVTIPNRVTNIGGYAFDICFELTKVYFQGDAPTVDGQPGSADKTVFFLGSGTVYYVPGTTGWGATFGGWPTAGWYQPQPTILGGGGLGAPGNRFGFTISWATNRSVVVESCTNLFQPDWTPVATNPLVGGTNYFSDPDWTNHPSRYYRLITP